MENYYKKIYLLTASAFLIFLLLILSDIDWQVDWFFALGILVLVGLSMLALINFEKLIILIIIALPAIFALNSYKINISRYLPFLNLPQIILNPISIIYIFLIVTGVIALIAKRHNLKNIPLKLIITLFITYSLISISWSSYKHISIIEFLYLIIPFMFYVISYTYFSGYKNFIKIIFAIILSSVIPVIISFYQIITNQYFFSADSSLGRLKGTFLHPNSLGLFLFVVLCLSISYYFSKKNKKIFNNKLLISYNLLIFIIFILTYSRISWASLTIFLILLIIIEKRLITFFGFLFPLAALVAMVVENIRLRILEILSTTIYSSWKSRLALWRLSLKEIYKNPFLGNGIGTSERIIEKAKDWRGGSSVPHNDFILHTIELGLIGVVLFIAYTIEAIRQALKTYKLQIDKYLSINIYNKDIEINFKTIVFCVFAMQLAIIIASFFESTSQKIIIQIMIWAVLGSMFSLNTKQSEL